ncbi:MAG: hypothetical protein WBO35_00240 [Candidatus Saccharimonadales bacterium]
MKITYTFSVSSLIAVTMLFVGIAAGPTAAAVSASPSQNKPERTVTHEPENAADESHEVETSPQTEIDEESPKVKNNVATTRAAAKEEIEKQRAERKDLKTAQKRTQVCDNRKKAIQNKIAAFTQAADKHLAKLSDIDARLQSYQLSNNIRAADYATVQTTAAEKKTAATLAVTTLKSLALDVDCSNPETVVALRAVKDAAIDSRRALHDYRMALKAMVAELRSVEKPAAEDPAATTGAADTGSDTSASTPAPTSSDTQPTEEGN